MFALTVHTAGETAACDFGGAELWAWGMLGPGDSIEVGDAGSTKGSGIALGARYQAIIEALKSALAAGWFEAEEDRGIVVITNSRTLVSRVAGELDPLHDEEAKVTDKIRELCALLNGRVVWEPRGTSRVLSTLIVKVWVDQLNRLTQRM